MRRLKPLKTDGLLHTGETGCITFCVQTDSQLVIEQSDKMAFTWYRNHS